MYVFRKEDEMSLRQELESVGFAADALTTLPRMKLGSCLPCF